MVEKKKNYGNKMKKETNWIGGENFDEKDFADGQNWKSMRK